MSNLLNEASLIVTPNGYKEGTLYSVIPSDGSGDMSVVRATTATRVNSAGLVELVPYNLFQYSEDFSNGYWVKTNATITTNTTAAPNFTLTADTITDNTTNGQHKVQTAALSDLVTGASFVASAYIKANTATRACVYAYGTSLGVGVDLLTGNQITVSGLTNASPGQVTITNVGNGWYYIELRATVAGAFSIAIMMVSGTDFSYAGSGNSLYYWGAQLTEGTIAKPYQKTETRLNIPRLDYSNGTCPSLLVEPQRTNLSAQSNDFNGWSTKVNVTTTANYSISPDGNTNADRIQFTANGFIYSTSSSLQTNGTTYTLSCYAKRNGSGSQSVGFFVNGSGSIDSAWSLTSEWQRFTYTYTASNSSSIGISGINGADVSVYGFQFEAGSYSTSYIPTTSASVTRNADAIYKTGISSLIGQTEGTVFWEGQVNGFGLYPQLFDLNADGNKFIQIYNDIVSGIPTIGIYVQNVSLLLSNPNIATIAYNTHFKFALGYKNNDYVAYLNGVQVFANTSIGVPPTSNFGLGDAAQGVSSSKKNVKVTALWKTRLTNDQLEQLTGTGFDTYAAMASFYNYTLQ